MKKVLSALLTVWVWTLGVEGPTLCKKHSEMHVDCISSAIWLRRPRQFEIILNAGHRGHTSELIRLTEIQEWIFLQNIRWGGQRMKIWTWGAHLLVIGHTLGNLHVR